MIPEGSVIIKKPLSSVSQNIIESTTNSFNIQNEDFVKFTFKSKQRYNDIKSLIKQNKGSVEEGLINSLPEREYEELAKEQPISVPEKYEAFLLEEVLIPPVLAKTETLTKPMFTTNFRLPDNLKIKTETAKNFVKTDNFMDEPYVHKFRDEFDPKLAKKQDFVLRLPKPTLTKVEMISEPLEKLKNLQKDEKKKIEAEEAKKRTELYGKKRGEWVSTFKPLSKMYELGTGSPHKLLPKDEYVEIYKTSSRES